jgi:UDP-N-acetylglucosamine 2-epimerase (non-hydrolysing)
MARLLFIFGTRPEIIKLAPVILECHRRRIDLEIVHTGQHKELAQEMLEHFGIVPDHFLEVMKPDQSLSGVTATILAKLQKIIKPKAFDMVIVQGDTTSVFCGALSAFYSKIPVAHVEAGLRTDDRYSPFPEEINRRLASNLATLHFAPTPRAQQALIKESIAGNRIFVTGNTVIDALKWSLQQPLSLNDELKSFFATNKRTILVTTHRRENFGEPHRQVFLALLALLEKFSDLQILFPLHLNPNVRDRAMEMLQKHPRIKLVPPLGYMDFIQTMQLATIIMTDSGGVQEEAPSLNKPVIVLRESTERPEGVAAGCLKLAGTNKEKIIETVSSLLADKCAYQKMAQAGNPFGDGKASVKIVDQCLNFLKKRS